MYSRSELSKGTNLLRPKQDPIIGFFAKLGYDTNNII